MLCYYSTIYCALLSDGSFQANGSHCSERVQFFSILPNSSYFYMDRTSITCKQSKVFDSNYLLFVLPAYCDCCRQHSLFVYHFKFRLGGNRGNRISRPESREFHWFRSLRDCCGRALIGSCSAFLPFLFFFVFDWDIYKLYCGRLSCTCTGFCCFAL